VLGREHRELANRLSGFEAFAGCEQDDLVALAKAGRTTSVPAHWTFVHEGTPADAVYVLLAGSARVLVGGEERAVLEPGAVIGEMALLGHSLRSANVVSAEPVEALRVEYDALAPLLQARPRLQESVGAVYAQHRANDAQR
jgi:CRP/FNR family transcriptional regulator, cyclic AMP receptor protein